MNIETPALAAEGIMKTFDGNEVLSDVHITLARGEVHALIGPNGAGKSTLFKIISGELPPTRGRVKLAGDDITKLSPWKLTRKGVGRAFQVARVLNGLTVAENLTISIEAADRWSRNGRRRDGRWVLSSRPWVREKAVANLSLLGIERLIDSPVSQLAHGDRKMVELALTLVQDPEILLLDEPMAGMSPEEVDRCSNVLDQLHRDRELTILLVEHDMDTVFRLASRVSVLANGYVIASGGPEEVRSDAAVREAYLGKART